VTEPRRSWFCREQSIQIYCMEVNAHFKESFNSRQRLPGSAIQWKGGLFWAGIIIIVDVENPPPPISTIEALMKHEKVHSEQYPPHLMGES